VLFLNVLWLIHLYRLHATRFVRLPITSPALARAGSKPAP
jgi:hypothetical protein